MSVFVCLHVLHVHVGVCMYICVYRHVGVFPSDRMCGNHVQLCRRAKALAYF